MTCVAPSLARVPERVGEDEPALGVRVHDLDRLAVRGAEDVARTERVAAGKVLRRRDHGDRAHRESERGDRAQPVERAGAARHVALHVLHPRGRLERDPARVERDRLADEAEQRCRRASARAGRSAARSAAARCGCRGRPRRARPCRAFELARPERSRPQVLVLAGERRRACSASVCGLSSFGGVFARSRARFVRSATSAARSAALARARRRLEWPRTMRSIARGAFGRPASSSGRARSRRGRPLDERARLVGERNRKRSRRAASRACRRRGRAPARPRLRRSARRRGRRARGADPAMTTRGASSSPS